MASSTWSLTAHLLGVDKAAYEAATRSPFLLAAGQGRLDTATLGTWLANDRLYIHAYLKAVGRTLSIVDLPETTTATAAAEHSAPETQLVDWLVASLAGLLREERFFLDVARKYRIAVDLETAPLDQGGREVRRVPGAAKLPGLVMFERLFGTLHPAASVDRHAPLPWLEAAVVFWGTEKVYSDAWRWAKEQQQQQQQQAGDGAAEQADADGGALRNEFIPNWANDGFVEFVDRLAGIVDGAVDEAGRVLGDGVRASLAERAERVWSELVAAEAAFWPEVE